MSSEVDRRSSRSTLSSDGSGGSKRIAEYLCEFGRPVEENSQQLALAYSDINDYVPRCLKDEFREGLIPMMCTIVAKCKKGETAPYFTYKLTWYADDLKSDIKKYGAGLKSRTSLSEPFGPREESTTCAFIIRAPEQEEPTRRCDGPCGQMRPIKELRQFGRCDHAICSLCIMNAPMVEAPDGSMGCCNAHCFAADLAAICPDPKLRRKYFKMIINNTDVDKLRATYRGSGRRNLRSVERALKQLSSLSLLDSSPLSGDIIKEMMIVNVMILENGPYQTIRRYRVSEELGSTCTIRKVIECMSSASTEPIQKARVFYSKGNEYPNSQLFEIDLRRYGDVKIRKLANKSGVLNFAVDFTNQLRGSPDSPYM